MPYKTGTDRKIKRFFRENFDGMLKGLEKTRGRMQDYEDQTGRRVSRNHKKNIRFYEEQGLLQIERAENGYREYHQKDVIRLQEIKLLRKIDISIEEMRALF